jgi:hypothetical protein
MRRLRNITVTLALAGALLGASHAAEPETDDGRFAPLQRFIGEWTGTSSGESGDGTVARSYRPVMNGRFIHETNVSRYPPQEKNKAGEVHEHWGVFSYDKARKLIVLRQFHVEGFVNTYRQAIDPVRAGSLTFDSESFENFSNSWKARETYEFLSDDEFVETFELAPPGKPYQVYSRNQLKRMAK